MVVLSLYTGGGEGEDGYGGGWVGGYGLWGEKEVKEEMTRFR